MSNKLYEGMGIFGHVPTPEEAHAKAFVMPRQAQPEGFWAGYCSALSDCGVSDDKVFKLITALCSGQFAHNVEPMFYDELEPWEDEDGE